MDCRLWTPSGPLRFALAAFALGCSFPASATTDELIESIEKACRPADSNGGRITPTDLRKALTKEYPIAWDWSEGSAPPSTATMLRLIETAGLDPGGKQDTANGKSFVGIGILVLDWIGTRAVRVLPYEEGGIRIVDKTGRRLSAGQFEPVLTSIFFGRDADKYEFQCRKTSEKPTPVVAGVTVVPKPTLTIGKAADELGKGGSDDQKAGEIAVTDDRVKGSTSFATNIAVGVAIPILRQTERDVFRHVQIAQATLIPFVLYNRQGAKDPTDKSYVNNLSFGVATNGFLVLRDRAGSNSATFSTYYSLNARYETDDRFHSDAWFVEGKLQPLLPLPGNTTPYYALQSGSLELGLLWTVTGVADYSKVEDPWKKQGLIDTKHFTRLGGDALAALIIRPTWGSGDWTVRIEAGHADRYGVSNEKGDAHLFSSKLSFAPTKNYSFGIGYDRGTELSSLARVRQWKVTVGLKK